MKLKFLSDAFYKGQLKYRKNEIYEISDELGEATRWLKRCAVIAPEEVQEIKIEEPIPEIIEEIKLEEPIEEEPIVKEVVKKDNVKGKRRKGNLVNETSEIL